MRGLLIVEQLLIEDCRSLIGRRINAPISNQQSTINNESIISDQEITN
jgi:hypothetical protein